MDTLFYCFNLVRPLPWHWPWTSWIYRDPTSLSLQAASPYYVRRCGLLLYTDRGLSVCHGSEPCKNCWTDRNAVWVEKSGGPKEPCIRWGSRIPHGNGQFWAAHCKVGIYHTLREPCNKQLKKWDAVWELDSDKSKEAYITWGAQWRNLANTIEPSMCGGDAVCCQITLATCYY